MTDTIRCQVRGFVITLLRDVGDDNPVSDSDSLFDSARLDSMAALQLTLWLEEEFSIDFSRLELNLGHFETIDQIVQLTEQYTQQANASVVVSQPDPTRMTERSTHSSAPAPQTLTMRFFVVGAIAISALHLIAAWLEVTPVRNRGHWDMLWDVDSYLWLHWVEQIHSGSMGWYERVFERINTPLGYESHWSIPYALLLYSGATLGSLFTDFSTALFAWGVVNGPLLHLAIFAALAAAVRDRLTANAPWLLLLMFLSLRGIFHQTAIGQADHHALLLLLFALVLMLTLSLIDQPSTARGYLTGALCALALWISVEGLVHVIAAFAALGLLWISDSERRTDMLESCGRALALCLIVALLLERAPGSWGVVAFDRLSIAHIELALLIWFGCAALQAWESFRPNPPSTLTAVTMAGTLAVALLGLFVLIQPGFFSGPQPWLKGAALVVVDGIQDEQPYLPTNPYSTLGFVIDVTPFLFALAFCGWVLLRSKKRTLRLQVMVILPFMLLGATFTLLRFRGLGYLQVALLLPWFWCCLHLLHHLRQAPQPRKAIGALLFAVVLAGNWMVATPLWTTYFKTTDIDWGIRRTPECRMGPVTPYMPLPSGAQPGQASVLTTVFTSTQFLLNTDLGVISAPYHRNVEGIEDALILTWDDAYGAATRYVARRHNLAYVAYCTSYLKQLPAPLLADRPNALISRIANGNPPAWLRPVPLPANLAQEYRIYQVQY